MRQGRQHATLGPARLHWRRGSSRGSAETEKEEGRGGGREQAMLGWGPYEDEPRQSRWGQGGTRPPDKSKALTLQA